MIDILAYGSLITHPGREIESVLDYVIPDVLTLFPVGYARRSQSLAGVPTLVPLETYEKGLAGLKYLRDNIEDGVMTSLTEAYRQAVVEKAGNSTDLDQARIYFALEKGILA